MIRMSNKQSTRRQALKTAALGAGAIASALLNAKTFGTFPREYSPLSL